MTNPISEEQYQLTQNQITLIGNIVADMPLAEFIAAIDRADTIAPMLDPTLYRAASRNLADIRGLAVALREFQKSFLELRARLEGEGGR